jgi:hypothetical protein
VQFADAGTQRAWQAILSATLRLRRERGLKAATTLQLPAAKASLAVRLEQEARAPLELAMRESLPYVWPQDPLRVAIWKEAPGEPTVLQGDFTSRGGFVAVSLPARWLTRVWARGLACVEGAFVIDVDAPAPASRVNGTVVRWAKHLGGHWVPVPATRSIERRGGQWHIAT